MEGKLVSRRTALKYAGLISLVAHGWCGLPGYAQAGTVRGYGPDPNLLERPVTWHKTLNSSQLTTLATLCDIVLPAEPPHPSAGTVKVHEFLDEWLSAPYPQMESDELTILKGLEELDRVMFGVCGSLFREAELSRQIKVFDRICGSVETMAFARRLIELICDGYYTTREGHAAIGYVGNVPLERFPGAPPAIVRYLEKQLQALPHTLASGLPR